VEDGATRGAGGRSIGVRRPASRAVGACVLAALAAALAVVALNRTEHGESVAPPSLPTAAAPADRCGPTWVASWQASPQAVPPAQPLAGRTMRMIVRPQVTGSEVRIRLSNRFGTASLPLGPVSVARAAAGAALVPGTVRQVTFGDAADAVVPPGAELLSDPVPVVAEAGRPLAVSLVLPQTPDVVAEHPVALQTSYLSGPGDASLDADGAAFTTPLRSWLVLTGVEVRAPRAVNAVVAMGDSITDGVGSGSDTDTRWSDALSDRLTRRGSTATMAVLNAGISRNELLTNRGQVGGDSPLARIGREVVDVPGATDVVLHIGTNDLAAGRDADEIVGGLVRFTDLAHAAGRRVFLTTITPSDFGDHGTRRAQVVRAEVNRWVRGRGAEHADGVFDFAAAVADPRDPTRLLDRYDAGDGLHLSGAGYRALADAVDVTRLTGSPCLADDSPARVTLADG
jgi:lysophospholipase L1-like esterase